MLPTQSGKRRRRAGEEREKSGRRAGEERKKSKTKLKEIEGIDITVIFKPGRLEAGVQTVE
jgi:hypothetical protein